MASPEKVLILDETGSLPVSAQPRRYVAVLDYPCLARRTWPMILFHRDHALSGATRVDRRWKASDTLSPIVTRTARPSHP